MNICLWSINVSTFRCWQGATWYKFNLIETYNKTTEFCETKNLSCSRLFHDTDIYSIRVLWNKKTFTLNGKCSVVDFSKLEMYFQFAKRYNLHFPGIKYYKGCVNAQKRQNILFRCLIILNKFTKTWRDNFMNGFNEITIIIYKRQNWKKSRLIQLNSKQISQNSLISFAIDKQFNSATTKYKNHYEKRMNKYIILNQQTNEKQKYLGR